jgi:hypothetical protein
LVPLSPTTDHNVPSCTWLPRYVLLRYVLYRRASGSWAARWQLTEVLRLAPGVSTHLGIRQGPIIAPPESRDTAEQDSRIRRVPSIAVPDRRVRGSRDRLSESPTRRAHLRGESIADKLFSNTSRLV